MSKYSIRVKEAGSRDMLDSARKKMTVEDLKKSPLGKTLQKLFDAGFVNTKKRYKTFEDIHKHYGPHAGGAGWTCWNECRFGEENCNMIFFMGYYGFNDASIKYVTVDELINMDTLV